MAKKQKLATGSPAGSGRDLELTMRAKDTNLRSEGDIFRDPAGGPLGKPVVRDVFVRVARSSLFHLDKGTFDYHFSIRDGSGDLTLRLKDARTGVLLAEEKFDSTYVMARIFSFTF